MGKLSIENLILRGMISFSVSLYLAAQSSPSSFAFSVSAGHYGLSKDRYSYELRIGAHKKLATIVWTLNSQLISLRALDDTASITYFRSLE
jgi:hypothetical protein